MLNGTRSIPIIISGVVDHINEQSHVIHYPLLLPSAISTIPRCIQMEIYCVFQDRGIVADAPTKGDTENPKRELLAYTQAGHSISFLARQ
jgi:hypothetical protein